MRGVNEAGNKERRQNPRYVNFGIEHVERRGERERLTSLLAAVGETVRVVCAPAGCGKTAAVRHYLAHAKHTVSYIVVPFEASSAHVTELMDGIEISDDIIVDHLDAGSPAAVDVILDRVLAGNGRQKYLLVGRSRLAMRVHRLFQLGLGTIVDASALAFTYDEATVLAHRHGVTFDEHDLVQLLHDTDGWAVALESVLADASRSGRLVAGAFDAWRERRAHFLLDLLAVAYQRDAHAYAEFMSLVRRPPSDIRKKLERAESLGFPVTRFRTTLRPYRVYSRLEGDTDGDVRAPSLDPQPLILTFLGRYHCSIGDRAVVFLRRRDQNVFSYVALSSEGRVTREELLQIFWPGVARTTATQSLRTTLSRIRSAIAAIVGASSVDRYFRSHDDVYVDFEHVTLDVRRFLEHVRFAHIEQGRKAIAAAKHHLLAAELLYKERLLNSEPSLACFQTQINDLENVYLDIIKRLVEIYTTEADLDPARLYGNKLLKRTTHLGMHAELIRDLAHDATKTA